MCRERFTAKTRRDAKKGDELDHNPLTIRLMPAFTSFVLFIAFSLRVFAVGM